ncbi:hypothetical protein ACP4OV_015820 [Aristida adscensionis]
MAMEPLPLFFGDGTDAALFSSLWPLHDDLQQPPPPHEGVAELKQSLVATTLELEAAREELKKKDQSIAKLADLVRQVAKERDDARDQLQHLRLLAAAAPPPPPAQLVTSSVTDSDCSLVSSPVDPFFDPVTSADKRCKLSPPTPPPPPPPPAATPCHPGAGASSVADDVLDMLAMKKPLPQKGRMLAAVMEAGPLLQNLLVAGQLPRWRNPPTVHAPDALAVGVRAGLVGVGAPLASGGAHAAAVLGYGGAGNACMKRPMAAMAALPLAPMAAVNCSPGFVGKRQRLH